MIESTKKTKNVKTYQNLVANQNLADITATRHICVQSCNKNILFMYNFNVFEVMVKYIVIPLVLYLETGNITLQNLFILICKIYSTIFTFIMYNIFIIFIVIMYNVFTRFKTVNIPVHTLFILMCIMYLLFYMYYMYICV